MESHLVDATSPDVYPGHAMADELVAGEGGGCVSRHSEGVNLTHAVPAVKLEFAQPVAARVGGDIGLIDRHYRYTERGCRHGTLIPNHEWSGQMHDVRLELR